MAVPFTENDFNALNLDLVTKQALVQLFNKAAGAAPVAATTTVAGIVKQGAAQVNSAAADVATLVTNFNTLLANLRTAGIIAP